MRRWKLLQAHKACGSSRASTATNSAGISTTMLASLNVSNAAAVALLGRAARRALTACRKVMPGVAGVPVRMMPGVRRQISTGLEQLVVVAVPVVYIRM